MAAKKSTEKSTKKSTNKKKFEHLVEELEAQFHSIHGKISKARKDYLTRHEKDFAKAKKKVDQLKAQFKKAKAKSAKAAAAAKKSGGKTAKNQWKKTKAAASLLSTSLKEAMDIMLTAEEKLNSAKPFDKKLAAREKALQAFEKEWEQKIKKEGARKAKKKTKTKATSTKTRAIKTKATAKSKTSNESEEKVGEAVTTE